MSAEPFDIDLVIDRLKDQVPDLRVVEGAAEYAAITSLRDFPTPGAYVLLVRERPDSRHADNARQRGIVSFGVVVAVKNQRGRRGKAATDELAPVLGGIRNAIIGWTPGEQGARPCRWIQGDTLDYDAGILLWSDVYQTQKFYGAGTA